MRLFLAFLIMSTLVLAGCGGLRDSRANPANWFGKSKSVTTVETGSGTAEVEEINPLIGGGKNSQLVRANATALQKSGVLRRRSKVVPYEGTLVDQVTDLVIERTTSGAIIRVTGETARQGGFDVRLLPENDGVPVDGVLIYTLNALQPINTQQGSPRTRKVQVAAYISTQDLDAVRSIQVIAKRNVRTSKRR